MRLADRAALDYALLSDAYALDAHGSGLGNSGFSLHYQPVMAVDGHIGGVEALLRYRYGSTLISPGEFIPLLERVGIFADMVGPIIDQVVLDSKPIHAIDGDIQISANFSIEQLEYFRPSQFMSDRLQRFAVPAKLIGIEVSEQAEIPVGGPAHSEVMAFSTLGHPILLDDYGIGYSNLSRLTDLPTSIIKLDKKFLAHLRLTDSRSLTIVQSVINLAHSLDLKITCEGVETQEQFDLLRSIGSDYFQGYLLARPMPLRSLSRLLKAQAKPPVHLTVAYHTSEVA